MRVQVVHMLMKHFLCAFLKHNVRWWLPQWTRYHFRLAELVDEVGRRSTLKFAARSATLDLLPAHHALEACKLPHTEHLGASDGADQLFMCIADAALADLRMQVEQLFLEHLDSHLQTLYTL